VQFARVINVSLITIFVDLICFTYQWSEKDVERGQKQGMEFFKLYDRTSVDWAVAWIGRPLG